MNEVGSMKKNIVRHMHLVSDSTGETLNSVARACLVQFENVEPREHVWSLVRTKGQMEKVLLGIQDSPGPVLMTVLNDVLRQRLVEGCREMGVPCIPVLEPVIHTLGAYFGATISGRPGLQHALDAEYFDRIEAVNYALGHDDGQQSEKLAEADVILVGVSRTSKTPTCIYLANRGIRAANVPIVPGLPLPEPLFSLKKPLIVGLTKDPDRLVQVRRNRLRIDEDQDGESDYVDPEAVRQEVADARRLYNRQGWPIIDVSRRSIEETAAAILSLLAKHREVDAS
ncbi:regulator of PEP synthase PpsR (kinase-PPPase family) [Limibacillus sp. MBR-115]|jgi:regulator of PEP synthase PpsR (kinase-PPPase family)